MNPWLSFHMFTLSFVLLLVSKLFSHYCLKQGSSADQAVAGCSEVLPFPVAEIKNIIILPAGSAFIRNFRSLGRILQACLAAFPDIRHPVSFDFKNHHVHNGHTALYTALYDGM